MSSNANTTATMDSIKKKMQAMKLEKENAVDRADQAEQRQKEFEEKLKTVSECCCSLSMYSTCVVCLSSPKKRAMLYKNAFNKSKLNSMLPLNN